MAQSLFQVGLGLSDDNIYYLSGSGAPLGTSGDITFEAPIGSYYSDASSGVTYKKVANNGNAADWVSGATSVDVAALQSEVNTFEAAVGVNADGSFAAYTGTNYLNSATSLKNADVLLDSAVKANADAIAAETSARQAADTALQSAIDNEVTRSSTADAALNAALAAEASARQAADATLQGNVDAEASARVAGDAALQAALATETSARVAADETEAAARAAADTALSTALASEVASRQAADDTETSARQAADATLQANIDAEAAARAAADATETSARVAADAALQAALDTETAARVAGDAAEASIRAAAVSSLQSDLTTEASARAAADADLQTQINNLSGGGAGTSLSSLQAEVDALEVATGQNADGTFSGYTGTSYLNAATSLKAADVALDSAIAAAVAALATETSARTAADTAEASARVAGDTALSDSLNTEIANRVAADSAEAAARSAADTALQAEIDTVEDSVGLNPDGTFAGFAGSNFLGGATTIKAGIMALDAQVKTNSNDIAALSANFATIDAALQAEVDRIEAASGYAATDGSWVPFTGTNYLDAVATIRSGMVALDTQIKTNADGIASEASARAAADVALQGNIDAEASARAAADAGIQAELDATQVGAGLNGNGSYTAPTLSNYLSTATSLKNADELLDAAIKVVSDKVDTVAGTTVDTIQAALDAETSARVAGDAAEASARQAADTALAAADATEASARAAADATLQSNIDAEAATRAAADTALTNALAAEASARAAADVTLQSNIDTETSARVAAVAAEAAARNAADVAEASARQAADEALSAALATETSARQAADATLSAADVAETSARTAADAALQAAIDTEVARATGAESAEASARTAGDAALAAYVGKGASAMPQYASTAYVATNDDLTVAVGKLDAAIQAVANGSDSVSVTAGVTAAAVVDSVSTKGVGLVKWLVYVQAGAAKQAVEVLASHDGDAVVDATQAQFTTYAKLRMGSIAGLNFTVSVSGSGAGQQLNLVVSSGTSATVRTVREVVTLA